MRVVLLATLCFLLTQPTFAQNAPDDLRDVARNLFADAIKLPFEEDFTFSQGPYDRSANALQVEPVFPLPVTREWLLITRVVATAVAYQPDSTSRSGGSTGLGDMTASFFLTPVHTGGLIWGLGPAVLIPTATRDPLGLGKWGLGPTGAVEVQPRWGAVGVLVQNIWSVAGDSKRTSVNQLELEPLLSYNLPRGWYLFSQPTVAADWRQTTNDRWLVPVGGGPGRTFKIGSQSIDSNITVYWNAVRPADTPKWQLAVQFTFLFPVTADQ